MLHHNPSVVKTAIRDALHALVDGPGGDPPSSSPYAPDVLLQAFHPLNEVRGSAGVEERLWAPMRRAFSHRARVDQFFTGGSFGGHDWISSYGHVHGIFEAEYLGISPTGGWAAIRFGEFHQIENGRIVRSIVIFDVPDLMRQAGLLPWRPGLGVETLQPGPATQDGVLLAASDPRESARSLKLVEAMIFEGLLEPAGELSTADQMRQYWTDDMMWYGPGLIGATRGIEGFYRFHEEPWERSVSLRGPKPTRAEKHVTRFGDGVFCSFTGWPSILATHKGPFLGLPASGANLDIRVMDFYHRRADKLDENWVFIDFPHLFLQLRVDLFGRMADLRDGKAISSPWLDVKVAARPLTGP
jgi:predicted ester cyclase